jgi:hypothetical protein
VFVFKLSYPNIKSFPVRIRDLGSRKFTHRFILTDTIDDNRGKTCPPSRVVAVRRLLVE